MAVSVAASGSQTATLGTEHTLADVAVAGTYELGFDTVNMAVGDYLEIRLKKIFKAGGTLRVVHFQTYQDAQSVEDYGKVSVPISNALTDAASLRFTLKQTKGTGRVYDWELLKFA